MPPKRKHALARVLRKDMTPPEVRLWLRLKSKPEGLHFRRQHPVGPYILDFYCVRARLAIEVEGEVHNVLDMAERDERRADWIRAQGIVILRLPGSEIMADADEVAWEVIQLALSRLNRGTAASTTSR